MNYASHGVTSIVEKDGYFDFDVEVETVTKEMIEHHPQELEMNT